LVTQITLPAPGAWARTNRMFSPISLFLDAELCLDQVLHCLRVGLAAGCLHHLADEPAGKCGLGLGLGDLIRDWRR
jgi:hypothetical protein